jgi:hypothetical protein
MQMVKRIVNGRKLWSYNVPAKPTVTAAVPATTSSSTNYRFHCHSPRNAVPGSMASRQVLGRLQAVTKASAIMRHSSAAVALPARDTGGGKRPEPEFRPQRSPVFKFASTRRSKTGAVTSNPSCDGREYSFHCDTLIDHVPIAKG